MGFWVPQAIWTLAVDGSLFTCIESKPERHCDPPVTNLLQALWHRNIAMATRLLRPEMKLDTCYLNGILIFFCYLYIARYSSRNSNSQAPSLNLVSTCLIIPFYLCNLRRGVAFVWSHNVVMFLWVVLWIVLCSFMLNVKIRYSSASALKKSQSEPTNHWHFCPITFYIIYTIKISDQDRGSAAIQDNLFQIDW